MICTHQCLSAFMRRPLSNQPVFRWHGGDDHDDHDGDGHSDGNDGLNLGNGDGGGLNFGNGDGGVIGEGHFFTCRSRST